MLYKNQVINREGKDWRIIHIEDGIVHLFPMDSEGVKLYPISYSTLMDELDKGEAKDVEDPYAMLRARSVEGKTEKKARERYRIIEPIVKDTGKLIDSHSRRQRIEEAQKQNKIALMTVYRLLNTWLKKGQSPNAMIPEYGKNTKDRVTKTKSGPYSEVSAKVPPSNEEVRSEFDKACHKYLLKPKHLSVKKAYVAFLGDYSKKHPEKAKETLPTIYQFKHYYNRNYPPQVRRQKQNDTITFNKDIRALTGSTYDIAESVGSIWEIDSTVADVNLVKSDDRTKPIGRPIIYSVVDVYTGMIVGVHVGLESAQYKTAAQALFNAMTDKVEFCRAHHVEITADEWPCSGIPRCIVADNAELSGKQIEHFARCYGTAISTTPSYRGDAKGTVESSIGLVQSELKGILTGEPDKRVLKKAGARDARLEATLTIEEYTELVIRSILIVNRRIRDKTPKGFPSTLAPTPLTLWNLSSSRGRVELIKVTNVEQLRISLLPHKEVSVSRNGFRVEGISYLCNKAVAKGYLDRSDQPDHRKMLLAMDPSLVDRAWLIPDLNYPLDSWDCELAPNSEHLQSMSWEEAKEYLKQSAKSVAQADRQTNLYAAEQASKQRELVKKSKQLTPKSNLSKAQRIASIKSSRTLERRRLQKQQGELKVKELPERPEQRVVDDKPVQAKYAYPSSIDMIRD